MDDGKQYRDCQGPRKTLSFTGSPKMQGRPPLRQWRTAATLTDWSTYNQLVTAVDTTTEIHRFGACHPRNGIVLVHLLFFEPPVFSLGTDMRTFNSVLVGTYTAAAITDLGCLGGVRPQRNWLKGRAVARKPPCWRQIVVWKGAQCRKVGMRGYLYGPCRSSVPGPGGQGT